MAKDLPIGEIHHQSYLVPTKIIRLSHEHRYHESAGNKGYHVEAVCPDDTSGDGDSMSRPAMVALLAYLKCYALDTEFHSKLSGWRKGMPSANV